ncbi:MAG: hypothetical protein HDT25_02585 [Ruminococcus sp.]|nr:hypothetical protein [Ruminococcus sp.]
MKCEIIKDLLPAYCDCVCSLETAAEIEQHTANCENCKKLLEDYRSDIEPLNKAEPEKPFRRIKRGIFRNKSIIAALILILVIVLSVVGYLTYGQIVRTYHPSFETIISSQKAKKITQKFCEGDIDYVMDNIQIYQTGVALYTTDDEIEEYCRSVLADFYEKYLKGKDRQIKIDDLHSGYECYWFDNENDPMTVIQIYDGEIGIFSLYFYERSGGKFVLRCAGYCTDYIDKSDQETFNLALNPIEPRADWETAILNNSRDPEHFGLITEWFTDNPEEERILSENTAALMETMECEKAYYSDFTFDAENSRYLIDMGFIFREKSSGKRVAYYRTLKLTAAFTYYKFEILPEFEPVIFDDGISAENRERVENLFILK